MSGIPRRLRALRSAAILTDAVHRAVAELDPNTQRKLIRETLEFGESALEKHRWEFSRPNPSALSILDKSPQDLPF